MDFSYVDTGDLASGDGDGAGDLQALISPGNSKKPLPPIWSEVCNSLALPPLLTCCE
jgi:hypothetical protein